MPSKERSIGLRPSDIAGITYEGQYSPDIAVVILQKLADGQTLTDICAAPDMPSRAAVHRWVNIHPEFSRAFMAARKLSAMAMEETALGLARALHAPNDFTGTVVRAYEVAMAQYRWSAARRDPERYGQQQTVAMVVPIQINTTLDLGEGAGSSNTPDFPDIYQIEARVSEGEAEGPTYTDPVEPAPLGKSPFAGQEARLDGAKLGPDKKKPKPKRTKKVHLKPRYTPEGKSGSGTDGIT